MPTIPKANIEKIEARLQELAKRAGMISAQINSGNLELFKKWEKLLETTKSNITKIEDSYRVAMQNMGIEGLIPTLKKMVMNSNEPPKNLKEIINTLAENEEQSNIITAFIRLEMASKNVDSQLKAANNKIEAIEESIFYLAEKNLNEIKKFVTASDLLVLKGAGTIGEGTKKRAVTRADQQEKIEALKQNFQSEPEKLTFITAYENLIKRSWEEYDREAALREQRTKAQSGKLTPRQAAFYKKLEKPVVYSDITIVGPFETQEQSASAEPNTPAAAAKATPPTIQISSAPPSPIHVNAEIANPSSPTGSQTPTEEPMTPEPATPSPITSPIVKPKAKRSMADLAMAVDPKRIAALEKAQWELDKAEIAKAAAAHGAVDPEAEKAAKAEAERIAREAGLAATLLTAFDKNKKTNTPIAPKPTTNQQDPEPDKPASPRHG
jgi:sulfur transfer protein SufE